MKRRILSIVTTLALCLSLCPTWAFAIEGEPDTGLCAHHPEHTADCGYRTPTEGQPCTHEHTAECYTIAEDGSQVLDCRHAHDSECGYVQADPGQPCGYECHICPIEDLIAALPWAVTEDNAEQVRGQLDEILSLSWELTADEQEQVDLSRCWELQAELDAANDPAPILDAVPYRVCDADGKNWTDGSVSDYTAVTAETTTWNTGWYVVTETVEITGRVTVSGAVHLILADGCSLTIDGITVEPDNSLSIYAQEGGTGSLTANGSGDAAGIGGSARGKNGGTITVYGGHITAQGGDNHGSGIGSGNNASGGTIAIHGGNVEATGGGYYGVGIGGYKADGTTIVITGGTVTAKGYFASCDTKGDLTFTGGILNGVGGCTVTFVTSDQSVTIPNQNISEGANAAQPEVEGWILTFFTDAGYTMPFDFGTAINESITIYVQCEENTDYIATVNGTNYTSVTGFVDAIENASGEVTATLLKDVDLGNTGSDPGLTVPSGVTLTLDCGEFTLNCSGAITIWVNGTLNFTGGTISNTEELGSAVYIFNNGKFQMSGGEVVNMSAEMKAVGTVLQSTVTILGGTVGGGGLGLTYTPAGGDNATLFGGMYSILQAGYYSDGNTSGFRPISEILAEGYALKGENGLIEGTATGRQYNVTVVKCTHPGQTTDLGDGTHGGTCSYCGTEIVSEPHADENGDNLCDGCGAALTVKVDIGGTASYYTNIETAWVAANGKIATVTLLADVTANAPLTLEGGDITFDGGAYTLTVQPSSNGYAITVDRGKLTMRGGTIAAKGTLSNGIIANLGGTFVFTGGRVEASSGIGINAARGTMQISGGETSGYTGLWYGGDGSIQISGGIFKGTKNAVDLYKGNVSGLLGHTDTTRYAFYLNGVPVTEGLDGKSLPAGTYTVDVCDHTAEGVCKYQPIENTATHQKTCLACGYTETANCTYGAEYGHDETNHWQTCTVCGGQKSEAHTINLTATASGSIVTVRQECDDCGYGADVGTVTFNIPADLTYKDDHKITWTSSGVDLLDNTLTIKWNIGGSYLSLDDCSSPISLLDPSDNTPLTPGSYKMQVTVKDSQSRVANPVEIPFTIDKATLTEEMVELAAGPFAYTGEAVKPAVTVTHNGTPLTEGTRYEVSYENNINAGTATVTVTGLTYYTGTVTKKFTIGKAEQAAPNAPTAVDENIKDTSITLDTIDNAEYSMDNTNWQASPTFTGLSPNQSYTFYTRLKENDNYKQSPASEGASITTKKTMLNGAVVTVSGTYAYDGTAQVPTAEQVKVVLNGAEISSDQYTVSARDNTNAGTATVTISAEASGDYSGSANGTFKIDTAPLTIKANDQIIPFGGNLDNSEITSSGLCNGDTLESIVLTPSSNQVMVEGKTITPSRAVIKNASGEDVTRNYTITYDKGTLTITPIEVKLTFDNQEITYGNTPTGATANSSGVEITYSYVGADGVSNPGWPTNVGTYTVTATVTANGNYGAATETATLTIQPKEVSKPTIELSPNTYVYDGQPKTPTVTVKDGNDVIPADQYTVSYSNHTNAGTATMTIAGKDGGNYTINGSASFAITAKPLTGASVNVSGEFTYTGAAYTPDPTVTLDGETLVKDTDYTVAYADNVNAGTATVTITGKGNYSDTVTGSFTIAKATLTVEGDGTAKGTYGDKLSELKVEGLTVTLNGTAVDGEWKLTGETVPNVGDEGTYTATFAPASGAGNYNVLTSQVTLDIAKADYSGTKTAGTAAKFGTTATYDLTALLPAGATAGTASTASEIFEGTPSVNGKSLSYELKAEAAIGSTGTITVPVTSTNYKDFNLTITVTVSEKDVPTLTISAITVTYTGEAVPNSAIKGTAKVGNTTVSGTWAFASGEAVTNVADSGTKTVIFTPTDKDSYTEVEGTVTVTINKATPTGTPKYTTISASGKTLADAGLTTEGSSFKPEGTVAWVLPTDTEVKANTDYEWTFTPTNSANYNTLTGTIRLWPYTTPSNPGSGSSYVPSNPSTSSTSLPVNTTGQNSSTVTTTTTATPTASTSGGKATTTVDTAMGNEIVKQAVANKSEDVVIAPKVTGNVSKTEVSIPATTVGQIGSQTNASLTIATPVADVTIPNGGLGSLSSAGGTVTVTAEQTGNTVELSVTAGGRAVNYVPGGLTLTVPMTNTTPGTVAVLVNADGTREVVRKSVADNGSVSIPLDGSAKLEIVDNSKYFYDVPATSWEADAVAFASAHELFNGTAPNQFSPNQSMSRGMLAVVLYNLESNPAQALTGVFADVSNSEWYAQGVAWAASNGIVTGYGGGHFGPNDNITREQLAVMLWRYAGSPAATDRELHFADAYRASDWALVALRWATENGVINGKGNGILDPGGQATRAETAQMLKNFMERR